MDGTCGSTCEEALVYLELLLALLYKQGSGEILASKGEWWTSCVLSCGKYGIPVTLLETIQQYRIDLTYWLATGFQQD